MNYWEKKKRIPRNNTEYKNIPQAWDHPQNSLNRSIVHGVLENIHNLPNALLVNVIRSFISFWGVSANNGARKRIGMLL